MGRRCETNQIRSTANVFHLFSTELTPTLHNTKKRYIIKLTIFLLCCRYVKEMNPQGGSSRAPALGGQLSPPGAYSSSSTTSSSRYHHQQQQQQNFYQDNSSIFNNIDCHSNSLDNLKSTFGPNSDFPYISANGIDNSSEFNGNMVAATGAPAMDGM